MQISKKATGLTRFLALCVLVVACRNGDSPPTHRVAPGAETTAETTAEGEDLSARSMMKRSITEERIAFVHDGDVIDTYDYVVRLTDDSNVVQCGGIAVGSIWVLTAAHCVPLTTRVFAPGAIDPTLILKPFCHPEFRKTEPGNQNARNDLALLQVQTRLAGSSWRGQVAEPAATNLFVMGWGEPQPDDNPDLIRSKAMSRQENPDCDDWWSRNGGQKVDAEEICVGSAASSACKRDSGGPLFNGVVTGTNLEFTSLVGILSKADDPCNSSGIFDIYTRIDTDWIGKITGNNVAEQDRSVCR